MRSSYRFSIAFLFLLLSLAASASSLVQTGQPGDPLGRAVDAGKVRINVRGTGSSSGDSVKIDVSKGLNASPGEERYNIPPGTKLSPGAGSSVQAMVVARVKGRMVDEHRYEPQEEIMVPATGTTTYLIEAYCAEFEKDNPSSSTVFTLNGSDETLSRILKEARKRDLSSKATQAAVWIQTNHATFEQLSHKLPVSVSDWQQAQDTVEATRLQPTTTRSEVLNSTSSTQQKGSARDEYELGSKLIGQGRYAEAEAAFRRTIDLEPRAVGAYQGLGIALGAQRKFAEAEAAFRKAIELNPSVASAHQRLAHNLNMQKKHVEAESAVRKAIELSPKTASAYNELGYTLGFQSKHDGAEAAFRNAIELAPQVAAYHWSLGMALMAQHKYAAAEAAYRKATELDANGGGIFADLARAVLMQGTDRREEATGLARKAISLGCTSHRVFQELGLSKEAGNPAQANRPISQSQGRSTEGIPANAEIGTLPVVKDEQGLHPIFKLSGDEVADAIKKGRELARKGKIGIEPWSDVHRIPKWVTGKRGTIHENDVWASELGACRIVAVTVIRRCDTSRRRHGWTMQSGKASAGTILRSPCTCTACRSIR